MASFIISAGAFTPCGFHICVGRKHGWRTRWHAFWKAKVKSKRKIEIRKNYIKTPKDIKERAFEFALRIIKLCQHLDRKPGVPRTLSYQLLKAGTFVGANIEEAHPGSEQTGFHQQELYRIEGGARVSLLVETSYRSEDYARKECCRARR